MMKVTSIRTGLAAILAGLLPGAAPAEPPAPIRVPDPDPAIELRSFRVADGFEVNLFAGDPDVSKPIQMNFDAAGRLWVATSEAYPQPRPGQPPDDKVLVLEDRDGDGRADRTTVFADGLTIPTGIEPGDGGAYVAAGTDLLHLADTDGDGRADRRRIVLTGFGIEDSHQMLHTFRWGPDGSLFMNQSVYIRSHVETPGGVRRLIGGGIWRYRPDSRDLEVLVRGFVNPWGHVFDRWGQAFVTDGGDGGGVAFLIPGGTYPAAVGAPRVLAALAPGSPKYCGAEILESRHLPPDWQGNLLTLDYRAHRVCRFVLHRDGAGWRTGERTELIRSDHEAFRPVDVTVGPDGAIYIADWYSPIIQHGEVDFGDPRRDRIHGRIWRVSARDRPPVRRPRLVDASVESLVAALGEPESWTRARARRLLRDRAAAGEVVLPVLARWVEELDPDDPESDHHRLEALWTSVALGFVDPGSLSRLADARDPRAREAAARLIGPWHHRLPGALELLGRLVIDDDPGVRLAALGSLSRIRDVRAAAHALAVLDSPMDRFLDHGLWVALRELRSEWLPRLETGRFDASGDVGHLIHALGTVESRISARLLVKLLREGRVPAGRQVGALELVAAGGGPPELAFVLDRVLAMDPTPSEGPTRILAALARASEERGAVPGGDRSGVGRLLDHPDAALRTLAARIVGLWRLAPFAPRLLTIARDPGVPAGLRRETMDALGRIGGESNRLHLVELTREPSPIGVRLPALLALAAVDPDRAAREAPDVLRASPDEAAHRAIFAAFLQREEGASRLAVALQDSPVSPDLARTGLRTLQRAGRSAPRLGAFLRRVAGIGGVAHRPGDPDRARFLAEASSHGDPAGGEDLFRSRELACLECHALAGAGSDLGPDLASVGATAPMDYLLESLLEPDRTVKDSYQTVLVTTRDGRLIAGIEHARTDRGLELRVPGGSTVTIPLAAIARTAPGISLMPAGLVDSLTSTELRDLLRFLAGLGTPATAALQEPGRIRSWEVLEDTPASRDHIRRHGFAAATRSGPDLPWIRATSRVSGDLPLEELPVLEMDWPLTGVRDRVTFVRFHLEAPGPGTAVLLLEPRPGTRAWLDLEPLELERRTLLALGGGRQTVTLVLDRSRDHRVLSGTIPEPEPGGVLVRVVRGAP